MYKIAIVIPTYNRADNLSRTLRALVQQSNKDFEVIMVDDGSTDNTQEVVMSFIDELQELRYYFHKNRGYRLSFNRNQGTRIVSKDITHILYVDSDVMLNPKSIEAYYDIISKHPDVVIGGRYDWMKPIELTQDDVVNKWEEKIKEGMTAPASRRKISQTGVDPRWNKPVEEEVVMDEYGVLSGNLLIPMVAFKDTGGFDQNIEGRGQDGEFGRNLIAHGWKGLLSSRVIGYHQSHFKDIVWETKSVIKTIKYISDKYNLNLGPERYPKIPKPE